MSKSIKLKVLSISTIIMLLLSACGAESTPDPAISTAIALTVSAQSAGQPATSAPIEPAAPTATQGPLQFIPTLTPLVSLVSPTPTIKSVSSTGKSDCANASMVSETIPDGTIYTPGEQFTKTWEIKNESNCTWGTDYKIIFWDGNALGGAYVYNLPQIVPPGSTFPISLLLTAPTADGTYKSEWVLQTPDGVEFGVGEYSASFYTQIVVSSAKKPDYAITSIDFSVVRTPPTGCPANVSYITYATFTSNGPIEIQYYWLLGSNTGTVEEKPKTLKFTEAGKQTVQHETKLHLGASPGDQRWKSIVIIDPYYQEFPHINFNYDCGAY
ncbi:MAG: NBR1-Ig-like domain-containing protein [Anaerolineales bacterium]